MEVIVRDLRDNNGCADVVVEHDGNRLEIGVLDKAERLSLASDLADTISNLLYNIKY